MKYLIRAVFALSPLTVFADPGHGAPVLHTHGQEVVGWIIVASVVLTVRFILSSRAKRTK